MELVNEILYISLRLESLIDCVLIENLLNEVLRCLLILKSLGSVLELLHLLIVLLYLLLHDCFSVLFSDLVVKICQEILHFYVMINISCLHLIRKHMTLSHVSCMVSQEIISQSLFKELVSLFNHFRSQIFLPLFIVDELKVHSLLLNPIID